METITSICLIGPESTGKSELAERLAKHYGVPLVREFARQYALEHGNDLTIADVDPIAHGQIALHDVARALSPRMLIEDTDLISTVVYSRYYYETVPEWIEDEARKRKADLYLLMDTDIEWKPDPARDAGGEAREDLFDAFRQTLDELETRWTIISGTREERFARAVAEVAG